MSLLGRVGLGEKSADTKPALTVKIDPLTDPVFQNIIKLGFEDEDVNHLEIYVAKTRLRKIVVSREQVLTAIAFDKDFKQNARPTTREAIVKFLQKRQWYLVRIFNESVLENSGSRHIWGPRIAEQVYPTPTHLDCKISGWYNVVDWFFWLVPVERDPANGLTIYLGDHSTLVVSVLPNGLLNVSQNQTEIVSAPLIHIVQLLRSLEVVAIQRSKKEWAWSNFCFTDHKVLNVVAEKTKTPKSPPTLSEFSKFLETWAQKSAKQFTLLCGFDTKQIALLCRHTATKAWLMVAPLNMTQFSSFTCLLMICRFQTPTKRGFAEISELSAEGSCARLFRSVRVGSHLVKFAISFLAMLGYRRIHLLDASRLACSNTERKTKIENYVRDMTSEVRISLKLLMLIIKGNSWYGSYGFKPRRVWERKNTSYFPSTRTSAELIHDLQNLTTSKILNQVPRDHKYWSLWNELDSKELFSKYFATLWEFDCVAAMELLLVMNKIPVYADMIGSLLQTFNNMILLIKDKSKK